MRILEDQERRRFNIAERDLKRVMGGLLVQDRDIDLEDRSEMEVVTERKPSEAEWGEMLFGWKVCKHVRSNAIVLSRELASVGIGAGQMSRVDSVRLAIEKARDAGSDLQGAALASDAFFPFADGPQLAVEAGVTSVIQPGGSKRDMEVVEAADAAGHRDGLHPPPPLQALTASRSRRGVVAPRSAAAARTAARSRRRPRRRPRRSRTARSRAAATRPERVVPSVGPIEYESCSIPAIRPRIASGIVWFHIVARKIPEDMSAAPAAASASSASGERVRRGRSAMIASP